MKFTITSLLPCWGPPAAVKLQRSEIDGISKSPAIFDIQKLKYINSEYIKRLSLDQFHELALPWIRETVKSDVDTKFIAELLQKRCEVLSDIPEQVDFIDKLPEYDTAMFVHKKMKTTLESSLEALKLALPVLEELDDYSVSGLEGAISSLIQKLEVKNGYMLWPLRCAVSGKQFTPGGAYEIMYLIGKDETLSRIKKGIELLSK